MTERDPWLTEREADVTIIHVCAGPPACELEGEDAVRAMQQGCYWCRRICLAEDGAESEEGPHYA